MLKPTEKAAWERDSSGPAVIASEAKQSVVE
jgi:hypothetical protein